MYCIIIILNLIVNGVFHWLYVLYTVHSVYSGHKNDFRILNTHKGKKKCNSMLLKYEIKSYNNIKYKLKSYKNLLKYN